MRFIFILVLIFHFVLIPYPADARKKRTRKTTGTCQAIILSDADRGVRLFGKNVSNRVLPASTTKVMTALLVMEKLSLDSYVTVRHNFGYVQPTKIDVQAGERYQVRELLYAILLNSANDASIVLAEAVAGSEGEFVRLMNERAKKLGARHTVFANSNGLPTRKATQYTTAFDMYMIFREALKYPFFRQAIMKRYENITSSTGRTIALKSHNKILFSDWKRKIYGKTGYTRSAGACFVGTVEQGNNTLIVGVFNCTDRWKTIKKVVSKYGGVNL